MAGECVFVDASQSDSNDCPKNDTVSCMIQRAASEVRAGVGSFVNICADPAADPTPDTNCDTPRGLEHVSGDEAGPQPQPKPYESIQVLDALALENGMLVFSEGKFVVREFGPPEPSMDN